MKHLCDSNVFLAMAVGQHAHHPHAAAWFSGLKPADTAVFCRATKVSFLRLLTQKIAPGYTPLSNAEAWNVFDRLNLDDAVVFMDEPPGLDTVWRKHSGLQTASPKRWMDAYLAAFAITAGMRLVTLDKDFQGYTAGSLDLLLLG
jgi:toxin-antitoxin system PIN domain toxin